MKRYRLKTKISFIWIIVTLVMVFSIAIFTRFMGRYYIQKYLEHQIINIQDKMDDGLTIILSNALIERSNLENQFSFLYDEDYTDEEKYNMFDIQKTAVLLNSNYVDLTIYVNEQPYGTYDDRDITIYHMMTNGASYIYDAGLRNDATLRLALPTRNFSGNLIGMIILTLDDRLFTTIDVLEPSLGYNLLINQSDEVLFLTPVDFVNEMLLISDGIQSLNYQGNPVIVFRSLLNKTYQQYDINFEIITVVNQSVLYRDMMLLDISMLIMSIIITLIVIFMTFRVSTYLTQPILDLTNALHTFSNTDMKHAPKRKRHDEIYELEQTYDEMIQRILDLIKKNTEEQEKQRKLELDALQMQINPHFLYNTLDAIAWMAKLKNDKEIETLVLSLAKFFRISLHKGDKFITVEEEIDLIKNFVQIELIRFPHKFETVYEIDEEIKDAQTLKLILQPVVENAIKHGISSVDYLGHLTIRAYLENDDIHFEVIDDGLGFDTSKIDLKNPHQGGYGLYNVSERIKLEYGASYGIFIESIKPNGTRVIIKIPYKRQ